MTEYDGYIPSSEFRLSVVSSEKKKYSNHPASQDISDAFRSRVLRHDRGDEVELLGSA